MNKLPNGWEYKKLDDLFKEFNEKNHADKIILASTQDRGVIPSDLLDRHIIRKKESLSNYKLVKKGCFVISLRSFQGGFEYSNYEGIISPAYTILEPKMELVDDFYKYYFKSYYFINKSLPKYAEGIRDGKQIKYKACKEILVPYPPLEKQKQIASGISKIDAYLENTIKLIEEKEKFKKGISKKLLTCKDGENVPEMRFKEFNDKWETVMLGDILLYEQPKDYIVKSEQYDNKYKYPVLTAGKTFILGYTNEEFGIYDKLPVIIFDDFTTDAKYVDFPFKVKSSAIKILKSKYYNTKLIYELMKNIKFNARTHKRYYLSEYQYLKIKIPKSIEEQEEISKFLSLLDAEIDNLKEQKEEIKKMKSGVIKKLMTGEVRL